MADSYSSKIQLWEGWAKSAAGGNPAAPTPSWPLTPLSLEHPGQLFVREALGPPTTPCPDGVEPFSLQWFLDIEQLRHRRFGRWLPSVLEFGKHAGETLLVMGTGLGTDWVPFAQQGASVVVCSPSSEQLALVRRNFELRDLSARLVQASPTALPIDPASIDVVCLTELLQHVRDPQALVEEVYRVLKPGGKVLAVTPARYDIEFWKRVLLPWQWRLTGRRSQASPTHTRRSLRGLFHRFVEHRIHKRHLRRADVPHLWRVLPTNVLERMIGRTLILKAFKPLSSAISIPMAA